AQAKLGVMYANGLGVKQDYQQSKSWYQKAAVQNEVNA
ncbi:SEL1-like repeat protein, partial [Klebsiella pneumoniae]